MSDELADIWLTVIDRFIQQVATRIVWERERGLAPDNGDALQMASALIWSTERLMYVAGKGLFSGAESEEDIVESLVALFLQTIYGPTGIAAGID